MCAYIYVYEYVLMLRLAVVSEHELRQVQII